MVVLLSAQNKNVFNISHLNSLNSIALDTLWKFKSGDDISYSKKDLNDSLWKSLSTEIKTSDLQKINFNGIGWFRLKIYVPDSLASKPIGLSISQNGASEYYLDGKLFQSFGKPSSDNTKEVKFTPNNKPVIFQFDSSGTHVLAIRYSNTTAHEMHDKYFENEAGFTVILHEANNAVENEFEEIFLLLVIFIFLFTFFITISFIHFLLFIFYRAQKTNIYYSIFIFIFGFVFLLPVMFKSFTDPDSLGKLKFYMFLTIPVFFASLLGFIYSLFYVKTPKLFWILIVILGIILILKFMRIEPEIISFIYVCIITIISAIEVFKALFKRKKGAWAIGIAAISFIILVIALLIRNALGFGNNISISDNDPGGYFFLLLFLFTILGIPLSMSIFLAREFASTSKNLSKKLIEVEELSGRSIEQEKEKQKILETQKEVLEQQVIERTSEISEQKKVIEEKNKDITDSINYAKRIQEAILPDNHFLKQLFPDSFILFKPKDIVSGDFYWFAEKGNRKIVIAADCTGHGVPGSLMSMIGSNILNKLILENGIIQPSEILDRLHKEVRIALKQNELNSETRDGMDIAVVSIYNNTIEFAGAHRPLWIIRENNLNEIKADKFSIGGIQLEDNRSFSNNILELKKGDAVYLFSDGFADQFGGKDGKKFMTKNFKNLLLRLNNNNMNEQHKVVEDTIIQWKGSKEQIDDILVIGIRI
jgi:serine phosphatase RsbU (regulator of sigma subunit)